MRRKTVLTFFLALAWACSTGGVTGDDGPGVTPGTENPGIESTSLTNALPMSPSAPEVPDPACTIYVNQAHAGCTADTSPRSGNSIDTPYCNVQGANQNHVSGDVVCISPGTYRERLAPRSGSAAAWTVYKGVGTPDQVIINGSDSLSNWTQVGTSAVYHATLASIASRKGGYIQDIPGESCSLVYSTYICYVAATDCWDSQNRMFKPANLSDDGGRFDPTKDADDVNEPGEYWLNRATGQVYLYPYDGGVPGSVDCSVRTVADFSEYGEPQNIVSGYLIVRSLTLTHSFLDGIVLDGRSHDIMIHNNIIAYNSGSGTAAGNPSGILHHNDQLRPNIVITKNRIHHQYSDKGPPGTVGATHSGGGITLYAVRDTVIANNEIHDAFGGVFIKNGPSGSAYENVKVENNYVHDTVEMGIGFGNAGPDNVDAGTIRGNLIVNVTGGPGIDVRVYNKYVDVEHNTLYNTGGINLGYESNPTSSYTIIRNNAVVGGTGASLLTMCDNSATRTTATNNLYFDSPSVFGRADPDYCASSTTPAVEYSSLTAWQAGTGLDSSSIYAAPSFVNVGEIDFRPSSESSELVNKGVKIDGYHCDDSDDTEAGQAETACRHWSGSAPDIGAYEFGAP